MVVLYLDWIIRLVIQKCHLFLKFFKSMFSPRGAYVTLIKSNRNKSIEQARQAYLGNKAPTRFTKQNELQKRYGAALSTQNNQRTSRPIKKAESLQTLTSRKKFKTLGRDKSMDNVTGLQETKCVRKTVSTGQDSGRNENMKKNQMGQNCRIALLNNGKTQKEYFLSVSQTHEIRDFLNQKQNGHFLTVPRQISLELAFSQNFISGKFLNGQSIYFKPEPKLPSVHSNLSFSNFQLIRPIGSGGFSQVFLTRSKVQNKFYALKLIQKNMIIKSKKQRLVMNERNIMINCDHPFVISLKSSFESEKYLVFVLEYCGGGELFSLIKRYQRLQEETAKFYIIEIFLGLQHLHSQKVVYRDIKPENILLGFDGHIKIADLGLAKPDMEHKKLAYSFCGSPEYMSPEMIMQVGHTYPVDYYCMGALLYQLLTGLPPFYNEDPERIYQSVVEEPVEFPSQVNLSSECRSLLKGLLCKDPKQRLGSLYGVKEILSHPWFGKQNYQKYLEKQIVPPIVFTKMAHFSATLDNQLDNKNQNTLESFLRDQKREKRQFQRVFKSFDYPQSELFVSPKASFRKKSEQSMKIPLIYAKSRNNTNAALSSRKQLKQNSLNHKRTDNFGCINLNTKKNISNKLSNTTRKVNEETYQRSYR